MCLTYIWKVSLRQSPLGDLAKRECGRQRRKKGEETLLSTTFLSTEFKSGKYLEKLMKFHVNKRLPHLCCTCLAYLDCISYT